MIVSCFLYSGGLLPLLSGDDDVDSSALRYVWLPLYFLSAVYAARHLRQFRQLTLANWPLLILVALCCISMIWSVEPEISLRRGIAVAATTLFAIYVVARFDALSRLRLLGWCFGAMAVSSLLLVLALPSSGVHGAEHAGAWRGIMSQKNAFGQVMVYGSAVFLVLAIADQANRRLAIGFLLFSMILAAMSTSVTSLIAMIVLFTVAGGVCFVFRFRALAVLAVYLSILVGAGLAVAMIVDPGAVFGVLGRDATLTGRTDIWAPLMEKINERFWLGYGYNAFWHDPEGPAYEIRKLLQWAVPSAHNGWAELWLDLGILGVGAFLLTFAALLYQILSHVRVGMRDADLWPILFIPLFVIFSFSESSILRHNDLAWVMYVIAVAGYAYRPVPARREITYYHGMGGGVPTEGWSAWRR